MIDDCSPDRRSLEGLRVFFVLGSFLMGGAERQAILLGRELMEQEGAKVHVWSFGSSGAATLLCDAYRLPWRVLDLEWPEGRLDKLKVFSHFAWALRKVRPDIILPYLTVPNTVCGLTWPLTGARMCVWNQEDQGLCRIPGRLERLALRQTTAFISNSQTGADYLITELQVDSGRVHVVRNGVVVGSPATSRSDWRKRLGVGDNCLLACMVANLTSAKDHATLLNAWRIVASQDKEPEANVMLALAGSFGETCDALKQQASVLGLRDRVQFLGYVEDVSGLLSAADLCVHSSQSEGCPNGVLEAMASGLPIVGTDIQGIREAVGPDGYDFLAPPEDAYQLAGKILALAHDPELRRHLGKTNRQRIAAKFSIQRLGRETADLLSAYLKK
jgi:glycosyltransferase involved in cell wall biosynthesis